MSDFFSDDFTAELKAYFLDTLILEADKFIDLIDEGQWKRIHAEVVLQSRAWAVDARTNEFLYLQEWLDRYEERTHSVEGVASVVKSLEALKAYAEALKTTKDSEELMASFSHVAENQARALFLHCSYGRQEFAVPLLSVVEIIGNLPLFGLPQKKQGLMGVIPFRGEAIPVVDFKEYGFLDGETDKRFYIVCEHAGARLSLQVTKTEDLVQLRDSELFAVEDQVNLVKASFVKQFFIKDGKSIMVLDLEKLVA